jgi:hypothetical protein
MSVGFELLNRKLQLRDLCIERFGGATELHPLKARQLQLQLLDEHIARAQLGGEVLDSIAGGHQELLQALYICRQRIPSHAPIYQHARDRATEEAYKIRLF